MNGLDIALIVVLFFFFIRGIFRGFVKEVTSAVGLVLGIVLACSYYPLVADRLTPFIQNPAYRQTLGFLVLFMAIFFVISLLGLLLDKAVKVAVSTVTNGLLGAAVALVKGIVLASVVLMATTAFIHPDTPFFKDSLTWPYMRLVSNTIKEYIPVELKKALESKAALAPDNLKSILPKLPSTDDEDTPPWKPALPESSESGSPARPSSPDR